VPTVLRWAGYRFYFFSNEGFEPPHIHVDKGSHTVKLWLEAVSMARNIGFSSRELRIIEAKVVEQQQHFLEAWHEHFRCNP
jgi:hypothetical protein